MAKVEGKLLKIYTGGTPAAIDCLTDASISLSREVIDTSCKDDTTGYASNILGNGSGSLSGTFYMVDDGTNNHEEIFTSFNSKTAVAWKISTETTGTSFLSGSGWFTSFEISGSINDVVTGTFTITINGTVTQTAVS